MKKTYRNRSRLTIPPCKVRAQDSRRNFDERFPVLDADGPLARLQDLKCLRCGSKRHSFPHLRTGYLHPRQLGKLPWSYPAVWKAFQKAAEAAGIGKLATHTMRHTNRAWLDAAGTPIAVQQKLMRHADIRSTMNIYGDVVTDEMSQAHAKVVQMVLPKKAVNGR